MRSLLATLAVLATLLPLRRYLLRGGREWRKGLLSKETRQETGEGRTCLGTIDSSVGDIDDAVPLPLMMDIARIASYASHRATLDEGPDLRGEGHTAHRTFDARLGEGG